MVKTLLLKEWRDRRWLFLIVIGLSILIHVVLKLLSGVIDYELYSRLVYLFYPLGLATYLGIVAFSREFLDDTRAAFSDSPRDSKKIFWIRYFSGLIVFLASDLAFHYLFVIPSGFSAGLEIAGELKLPFPYLLIPMLLIYPAACLSVLLFGKKFLGIIFTPILLFLTVLLVLPLFVVLFITVPSVNVYIFSILAVSAGVFALFSFILWQRAVGMRVKAAKRIAVAAVSILAFSFAVHTAAYFVTSRNLERTAQKARSEGIKLLPEEVIPPSVPVEDNAALVYEEAYTLSLRLEEKYQSEWEYMPYESRIPKEELKKEQKLAIAKIMEYEEFVRLYELIDKGVNLPAYRSDIDYQLVTMIFSFEGRMMRRLARMLAARVYILSEEGRFDEAVESAKTFLLYANALQNEPIVLAQLVRIAVESLAVDSLNQLINNPGISVPLNDYYEFISIIEEKDIFLEKAFNGEMVLFESMLLTGTPWVDILTSAYLRIYRSYLFSPIYQADEDFLIRNYLDLIKDSRKPYFEVKETEIDWIEYFDEMVSQKFSHRLVSLKRMNVYFVLPAFYKGLEQQARINALLDTCKLGLAIEMFRDEHGAYPDSMEALVPEIIPELPFDPFTGSDYIYRRKDEGFIVYSVGPSGRDDGGIFDRSRGYDDIVWEVIRREERPYKDLESFDASLDAELE